MFEIQAKHVVSELKKIAFFLQNSGVFDEIGTYALPAYTKNTLENMANEHLTWESAEATPLHAESEKNPDKQKWLVIVKGTLANKPVLLRIRKTKDRNVYKLIYEGNEYTDSKFKDIEDTIDKIISGKRTRPEMLLSIFNLIQKNKDKYLDYISRYYLSGVSTEPWSMAIVKKTQQGSIIIRFYLNGSEKDRELIEEKLTDHNYSRLNTVGTFLKQEIRKLNVDTKDFKFEHKFIRSPKNPDEIGFLITIK